MAGTENWATEWLTRIVADGGAHGPGSRRTIEVSPGDTWSYLYPEDTDDHLAEMRNPLGHGGVPKSGRWAATYEQPWNGGDALWMEVVEFADGASTDHLVFVQPYRRRWFGRCTAIGQPRRVGDPGGDAVRRAGSGGPLR